MHSLKKVPILCSEDVFATTVGSVVVDVTTTIDHLYPVLLVLESDDGAPESRLVTLVRAGENIELETTSIYHGKCELSNGLVCVFSRRDHGTDS